MSCLHVGCKNNAEVILRLDELEVPLCKQHLKEIQNLLTTIAVVKGRSEVTQLLFERRRGRLRFHLKEKVSAKVYERKLKELERRCIGFDENYLGRVEEEKKKKRRRKARKAK